MPLCPDLGVAQAISFFLFLPLLPLVSVFSLKLATFFSDSTNLSIRLRSTALIGCRISSQQRRRDKCRVRQINQPNEKIATGQKRKIVVFSFCLFVLRRKIDTGCDGLHRRDSRALNYTWKNEPVGRIGEIGSLIPRLRGRALFALSFATPIAKLTA